MLEKIKSLYPSSNSLYHVLLSLSVSFSLQVSINFVVLLCSSFSSPTLTCFCLINCVQHQSLCACLVYAMAVLAGFVQIRLTILALRAFQQSCFCMYEEQQP
ncbi:hypothetical protein J3F83DRAFT_719830 [Trichoderma novae-zelandiae]